MPTYEFECEACGHRFEVRQSIAEHGNGPGPCPRCASSDRVHGRLSTFTPQTERKS